MGKNMIIALIASQFGQLNAKTNVEKLRYTVAGVKDGRFYDYVGTDYGMFDEDAKDIEFLTEVHANATRINATTLAQATVRMQKYFVEYLGTSTEDEVPDVVNVQDEAPTVDAQEGIDYDAVTKACKKAIKKGDKDKAVKLLEKLIDQDSHKKLSKKIGMM